MALAIAQAIDAPEIVGRVLAGRGVSVEHADGYLNPKMKHLMPDPSTVRDMDVAVPHLVAAIDAGEKLAVFGDYDVDGATSSALLASYFADLGVAFEVYIPDRRREGYGPNVPALQQLHAKGVRTVITVDCGTTSYDALTAARDMGLEVIVVDHHLAETALPRCRAVVNPNRLDDNSGLGALAAVGVTFLLVVALNRALRKGGYFDKRAEPSLMQWLDLVALGTVCDLVPMIGLNRALVVQGLKILGQRRNVGLAALADVAGAANTPDTYMLGYVLGPRINAGGRVGQARLGHELIMSASEATATDMARQLDTLNAERKAIEADVLAQAETQVNLAGELPPVLIAAGDGWHVGVLGLAASRLTERYGRPSIVIGFDGDVGKGSARSVPGVDIGAAIVAARQAGTLSSGGGHVMAAGLSVMRNNFEKFATYIQNRVASLATQIGPLRLGLDGALAVPGATSALIDLLDKAGPYGTGNPQPRFCFANLRVTRADIVGAEHVRCTLADAAGTKLNAIAFRSANSQLGAVLQQSIQRPIHAAGKLQRDRWRGRGAVQLILDDIAYAD